MVQRIENAARAHSSRRDGVVSRPTTGSRGEARLAGAKAEVIQSLTRHLCGTLIKRLLGSAAPLSWLHPGAGRTFIRTWLLSACCLARVRWTFRSGLVWNNKFAAMSWRGRDPVDLVRFLAHYQIVKRQRSALG